MNSKYIYLFLIVITLFFCACGDDDKDGALHFMKFEIEDGNYKVYAGSNSGGVAVPSDSLKKIDVSKYINSAIFESYANSTILFTGDEIIVGQTGAKSERNLFKFEEGSLYIQNGLDWRYFGDGDVNNVIIRQHYIAYKKDGSDRYITVTGDPQKEINAEGAATRTVFQKLSGMRSIGDTLVFCTRSSFFQ